MSGHWICDACGYDGQHADYCKYLRPIGEQWRGHRSKDEILSSKLLPTEKQNFGAIDKTGNTFKPGLSE